MGQTAITLPAELTCILMLYVLAVRTQEAHVTIVCLSPPLPPSLSFPLLSGEENDLTFTTDQINGQSGKGQQREKVLDSLASRHGKISEHITTVG